MKTAVWATVDHSMSTDTHPQNGYCPKASDSWCFNQAAVPQDPSAEPKHDNAGRTSLSPDVAQKMLPFYKRMSDDNLLKK